MKIKNLIPILFFFLACKQQPLYNANDIVIEGQVENMPDGKIYLAEVHREQTPLYTTECKNGHFLFKITPDSSFVPFKAAIYFPDGSAQNKPGSLHFRNHMLGADSIRYSGDAFYLEKGYTRIEGDRQQSLPLRIFAGKETDLLYKYQFINFGLRGEMDSVNRSSVIQYFKHLIQQYPFSWFLLQSIYNEKEQYSKNEIKEMLSLFDADLQQSKAGRKFTKYLANRPDPNEPFTNLSLPDSAGQKHLIIDTTHKLNMLVFWASWCGPCKKEIPVLKQIHKAYKKKGVKLVSISIDDNKADWMRALKREKMLWPQYIVDGDQKELVHQQFNFSSIPLIVFTDKNRKLVTRLTGYNKEEKNILDSVINKILLR